MEFNTYATIWDAAKKSLPKHLLGHDPAWFYKQMISDACNRKDVHTYSQAVNELDWEQHRRPYYNVFPSIIPMLTRLNLENLDSDLIHLPTLPWLNQENLDSDLIHLPMSSLCIRLPKDPAKNPLGFDWKGERINICSILIGDILEGKGISVHFDIVGKRLSGGWLGHPFVDFPRKPGLTVEQSIAGLSYTLGGESDICIPSDVMVDGIRLCCTLCLLENDPSVISPDVLDVDRRKYEATGNEKYMKKAHRRGRAHGMSVATLKHFRTSAVRTWHCSGRERDAQSLKSLGGMGALFTGTLWRRFLRVSWERLAGMQKFLPPDIHEMVSPIDRTQETA